MVRKIPSAPMIYCMDQVKFVDRSGSKFGRAAYVAVPPN